VKGKNSQVIKIVPVLDEVALPITIDAVDSRSGIELTTKGVKD
jgi:hypothetical protein